MLWIVASQKGSLPALPSEAALKMVVLLRPTKSCPISSCSCLPASCEEEVQSSTCCEHSLAILQKLPTNKESLFPALYPACAAATVLWRSGGDLLRVQCVQSEGCRRERGGQPWRPPLCRGTVWRRLWLRCQGRSWCSGAAGPECG